MAFKNFAVRNGLEVEGSVILSGSTSGTTEIKAAADALGIYTLPSALPTASGQVLTSTTLGVTSWSPALTTTGGDVTLAAPTGGSNTVIVTADQRIEVTRTTATTNAAVNTLQLRADSSGTPSVGFGTSLLYQVETDTATFKDAATINVQSTDVTTGSEDFRMNFTLMQNGAANANRLSLFSNGDLEMSDGGKLFIQGATNGYTALGAPATGSNITYTLPGADGTSGQVLSTNGSGTLSWTTASGGGGSPGGSNTQVQFNNSGAFGGSANMTWDGTTLKATQLESTNTSGDEGGEIKLNKATTNTTLTTGVTIDVYQNKLRLFETGGSNRGAFLDIGNLANGVVTNLAPLPAIKSESLAAQPWSTLPGCVILGSIGNSLTISAQQLRHHPFYVSAPITLTEVALQVSTATTLASCNAMIYIIDVTPSTTGWQPSANRSGGYCGEITNITTTGIKSITGLSISLPAGAYLMAVHFSNYTGTLQCRSIPNQVITGNGYCFATSDGTTYAMNRTGVAYVSGTPAAVGNWTNGAYGNAGHPGVVWAKWTVN